MKQPRGTQRYRPTQRDDEDTLTQTIVTLASQYGRYGYRRITALLTKAGEEWQGPGRADLHPADEDQSVEPGSGVVRG